MSGGIGDNLVRGMRGCFTALIVAIFVAAGLAVGITYLVMRR